MRINHIAINCADIDRVKDFFIRYFDAREGKEYHNTKTGLLSWMLLFTEGSTKLELMSWHDVSEVNHDRHRQGLTHLSISVGDRRQVDAITALLETDGYKRLDGPRVTGDGYYESCVLGPEELEVEITV